MQITVNLKEFASTFRWAYGGLPKRVMTPVLLGIRLAVEDHALTLSVFDYEQSRRARLSGENAESGQILVDGQELKKIAGTLPKGNRVLVDFSADSSVLTLASQGITWTLPALPEEEYPALPELPPLAGVAAGDKFARAVGRVFPAASADNTRPVLTCIHFETHSAALSLAATDKYRLALDRVFWTPANPEAPSIRANVPAQAVQAFAKIAGQSGNVAVYLSERMAGFRDDERELTIRTQTGAFPRFGRLLRTESPVTLTADAKALAAVVERMGKVSERVPGTGDTPVALVYAGDAVTVKALTLDGRARATETLPAEAEGATGFEVLFNSAYLASMLQGIDGKAIIGLAGDLPREPKSATVNAAETDTFTALVIPVRKADR